MNDETLSLDGWFAPFSAIFLGGPLKHELKFNLGNINLESSGSVADAATWTGANLTAQLHGPEMADILKEFKLPLFSEGKFDFTLRLNTEGDMTKLDLNGDLGSVDIGATGELDRLIKPSKGNVQFSVDGPNLGALAKIFGVDGLVEDAFSHEAHASFSGDAIHFKKATLKYRKRPPGNWRSLQYRARIRRNRAGHTLRNQRNRTLDEDHWASRTDRRPPHPRWQIAQ